MEVFVALASTLCVPILIVVLILGFVLARSIRILREYERGVLFRLGRIQGLKGPGVVIVLPIVDGIRKIDLRIETLDLPSQEAITKDNITVRVNAVVLMRVIDASKAVLEVQDYRGTVYQIAQTTLRAVLGQSDLDELLSNRDDINDRLQKIIDEQTEPWGVKVTLVEVKDVELPDTMKRAMARQAEAEREKRSKIINAEGEFQAAQRLAEAAEVMTKQPAAIQLRYLQTLTEISIEKNSTILAFLPPQDYLAGVAKSVIEATRESK